GGRGGPAWLLPEERARPPPPHTRAVLPFFAHPSPPPARVRPLGRPRPAVAVAPRIVADMGAGAAGAARGRVRRRLTCGLTRAAVLRRLQRHADEALGPAVRPGTAGGGRSRARAWPASTGAGSDAAVRRGSRARLVAARAAVRDVRFVRGMARRRRARPELAVQAHP